MQIRKVLLSAGLVAAFILTGGCRGKHSRTTVENEEPVEATPRVASALKVNDPGASAQLIKGFYGVEGGSWRWTSGHFSVVLHTPAAAAQHGAVLAFALNVPDVVIQKLGSITLSASAGETRLKSETYSKPGSYTFTADVPAGLLAKDTVTVDFALDKSLTPGMVDQRELGVIATGVDLSSK